MKFKKIILSAAVALTAFWASVGLLKLGDYLSSVWQQPEPEVLRLDPPLVTVYRPPIIDKKEPETPEAEEYVHKEFEGPGEDGYYYLIGNPATGKNPKGFEAFVYFELETYRLEEKTYKQIPIKPTGSVYARFSFDFKRLQLSGKNISFTTEKYKGVSYQFEGRFVDETITAKYIDGGEYTDTVAIKGTLTKWKNGVKIAEAKVNFGFTIGC